MAVRHEDDDADEWGEPAADDDLVDDREAPDPSDQDDDEDDAGADSIPCPFCGRPVHESADVCPHCRNFITGDDAPRRYPWWLIAGVIGGLVAMLGWVFV